MPPRRDTHGHAAAAVVSALGQEFDVDQVRLLCLYDCVSRHGTLLLSCALWLMRAGTPFQCKMFSCLNAMTARQEAFKSQMCRQHPNTCLLHFAVLYGYCEGLPSTACPQSTPMGLTCSHIILQAFADAQSAMLADLPSVEDGEFTQTQAGQPASATFESMDADEGMKLPGTCAQSSYLGLIITCLEAPATLLSSKEMQRGYEPTVQVKGALLCMNTRKAHSPASLSG